MSGQDREEITICLGRAYDNCIIRSERDLRVKIKITADDEGLDIIAYLFDAADHANDPSYEDRLVIEQELWTLSEYRDFIAQDLENEEEIELEFEEALDQFMESSERDLSQRSVNFGIWF